MVIKKYFSSYGAVIIHNCMDETMNIHIALHTVSHRPEAGITLS